MADRRRAHRSFARQAATSSAPTASSTGSAADASRPLLDALRAVVRALRLADRAATRTLGLPAAQAHVLRALAGGTASSLGELAARTHTDPSSVCVVVQRLVAAGLVARTVAADDRRRIELALTPAGRARLRGRSAAAEQRLAEAVAGLGAARAAALARGLETLTRTLRQDAATSTTGERAPIPPSRSAGAL